MHPQPETYWGNVNPIGPRGVYDESKRYAEALTMAYHRQQGVDTCIARIFNTYGPRMRPNDGRAVPTFVRQALADKPLTVFGDGSQTRASATSTTSSRASYRLASSGEHVPVNLGNPAELTLSELAETVMRVTGSAERDRLRGAAASTTPRCGGPTSPKRTAAGLGAQRSNSATGLRESGSTSATPRTTRSPGCAAPARPTARNDHRLRRARAASGATCVSPFSAPGRTLSSSA